MIGISAHKCIICGSVWVYASVYEQKEQVSMIRVLFVCLGNICRSPMAEGVFQHRVNAAGLAAHITSDSAGTGDWHSGEPAHRGTLALFKQHNIPYSGRARQVQQGDFANFDYIFAMDRSNLTNLQTLAAQRTGKATLGLFLADAHSEGAVSVNEVPDPYYDNSHAQVWPLVTAGAAAVLARICREYGLHTQG
jgi:protein-tyrosine phosphatase